MRRLGTLVAVVLLLVSPALCQSRTTCGLSGSVGDDDGRPLPGARILIESPALVGGSRSTAAGPEGRFRFPDLPPGKYAIEVSLPGYKSLRIEGTELSVGMNAVVPVRMVPYALEETVHVRAAPVAIDPTSSAAPTVLPPEFLRNVPSDRDSSHILDFAPGINIESAYGGGEEAGNAYQMDGVDISDPEAGAPWSSFNTSLIEEVQLIGLGAPAEYGGFTGVVVNSVTRSGGNEASGEVEAFSTVRSLTGSTSGDDSLVSTIENHFEGTVQAGGPIVKDKLWYFVSAQYVHDVSSEGGPNQTETDPRLFGKLTWQASAANSIQGWLQWDHTRVTGRNGDAFTPLEATSNEDNPEFVWNLSWRSILSPSTILFAAWAGTRGRMQFDPHNGFSIPGRVDAETDLASDNAALFQAFDRTRNQVNVSLAQHLDRFIAGEHDLKFGTEIERSSLADEVGFPGGAFYSDNEGPEVDPSTGQLDRFTLGYFGGGYAVQPRNERISLYAQDSWRITPSLTLNPGLRLDLNRGEIDGIPVFKTHPLALRIGLAWDLLGNARSVLKAHYGRYYEALYSTFYQFGEPDAFGALRTEQKFNTSGFSRIVANLPAQTVQNPSNLRQPYIDQFVLGYDQELLSGLVVSGTLVYRKSSDFIQIVSRHGQFVPVRGEIPELGGVITLYDYLNVDTDSYTYANPAGLTRTYRAGLLSLTRRMSDNWQLSASYVYSEARGNVDNLGFETSPADISAPDLFGLVLQTPNSLVNAEGRLTHDQTNQIKLQGTWIVPALRLSVSGAYVYHSGDTWTPRASCLLTDDGNGVIGDGIKGCHAFTQGPFDYFAEPRGSRRLPGFSQLDLRVEWSHPFARGPELRLLADIFNATNRVVATEVEPQVGEAFGSPATLAFPRNIRIGASLLW